MPDDGLAWARDTALLVPSEPVPALASPNFVSKRTVRLVRCPFWYPLACSGNNHDTLSAIGAGQTCRLSRSLPYDSLSRASATILGPEDGQSRSMGPALRGI